MSSFLNENANMPSYKPFYTEESSFKLSIQMLFQTEWWGVHSTHCINIYKVQSSFLKDLTLFANFFLLFYATYSRLNFINLDSNTFYSRYFQLELDPEDEICQFSCDICPLKLWFGLFCQIISILFIFTKKCFCGFVP